MRLIDPSIFDRRDRVPKRIARLVLATVVVGLFANLLLPAARTHAPSPPVASTGGWLVRDMGMTAVTHDTVCNQFDRATMTRLVSYVQQFHANFASDDLPLDDASGFRCTPRPLSPYG